MGEHAVWGILDKSRYFEGSYKYYEGMYDLIKGLVDSAGDVEIDGVEVPAMRAFFNHWNRDSAETFRILESLVSDIPRGSRFDGVGWWKAMSEIDSIGSVPADVNARAEALYTSGLLSDMGKTFTEMKYMYSETDNAIARACNLSSAYKVHILKSSLSLATRRFVGDILFAKEFDMGKFEERVNYLKSGENIVNQDGFIIGLGKVENGLYKGRKAKDVSLYELGLPARVELALCRAKCWSVGDLIKLYERKNCGVRGIGDSCLEKIKETLIKIGAI